MALVMNHFGLQTIVHEYSGICYYDISHESFWTSNYSARILEPK